MSVQATLICKDEPAGGSGRVKQVHLINLKMYYAFVILS